MGSDYEVLIASWAWMIIYTLGAVMCSLMVFLSAIIMRSIIDKRWLIEIIRMIKVKVEGEEYETYVSEHRVISVNEFDKIEKEFKIKKLKNIEVINFKWLIFTFNRKVRVYEEETLFKVKILASELYRDSRAKKWAIWYFFSNCRGKYLTVVDEKGSPYKYYKSRIPGSAIFNARNSTAASKGLNSEYKEGQGGGKIIIIILAMILFIVLALVVLKNGGLKFG